jgi:protein involved in ribonucleotide reduction
MLVLYDSKTGNVKRFISKLPYGPICISERADVHEPFCLVTYTTGMGQVPPTTVEFLQRNGMHLKAVASSGNKNWGANFGNAAKVISKAFQVPIIHIFELSGTGEDVEIFIQNMSRLES